MEYLLENRMKNGRHRRLLTWRSIVVKTGCSFTLGEGNCRDDAGDVKLVLLISKVSVNFHLNFIDMIRKCLKKKKKKKLVSSIHVKLLHTF